MELLLYIYIYMQKWPSCFSFVLIIPPLNIHIITEAFVLSLADNLQYKMSLLVLNVHTDDAHL